MQPTITEIAPDISLISIYSPGSPKSFDAFLSCDGEPETCANLNDPFHNGTPRDAAAG